MRILYLTHYYPPEVNAPAQRVESFCRAWAQEGDDVHVVTGIPSHPAGVPFPGYRRRWYLREELDGVSVHRVGTFLAPNRGVLGRGLNYASFMPSGTWRALRLGHFDVVVATSPQILCAAAGGAVGALRRVPWIFEVRDLWPESIAAVGALRDGPLLRALDLLAARLYHAASAVVCVSPAFVEALVRRGVPRERLHYVPNGVDLLACRAGPDEAVRRSVGVGPGETMVLYAGTMGLAHGLDTVLDAARRLRACGGAVRFVLAGDGADLPRLHQRVKRERLEGLQLAGLLPRDRIAALMAACDVALVPLRRTEIFRMVVPSKMIEAMGAGKPVVLGVEGEAARILRDAGGGICVAPEDSEALAGAITRLASDGALRVRLGTAGRAYAERELSRTVWSQRYREVLASAACGRVGGAGRAPAA